MHSYGCDSRAVKTPWMSVAIIYFREIVTAHWMTWKWSTTRRPLKLLVSLRSGKKICRACVEAVQLLRNVASPTWATFTIRSVCARALSGADSSDHINLQLFLSCGFAKALKDFFAEHSVDGSSRRSSPIILLHGRRSKPRRFLTLGHIVTRATRPTAMPSILETTEPLKNCCRFKLL